MSLKVRANPNLPHDTIAFIHQVQGTPVSGARIQMSQRDLEQLEVVRYRFVPSSNETVDIFFKAIVAGNYQEVRKLSTNNQILFSAKDGGERTALMLASLALPQKGEKIFNYVLEKTPPYLRIAIDDFEQNALFYACASMVPNRIQALLKSGVEVIGSRIGNIRLPSTKNTHPIFLQIAQKIQATRRVDMGVLGARMSLVELENPEYLSSPDLQDEQQRLNIQLNVDQMKSVRADVEMHTDFSREKGMAHIFGNQKVRLQIARHLKWITLKGTKEAAQKIRDFYGINPGRTTTREILREAGIATLRDRLRFVSIKETIGRHFQENPPATIQEAIDYIKAKYRVRCQPENVQKFLAHFGIHVPSLLYDVLD